LLTCSFDSFHQSLGNLSSGRGEMNRPFFVGNDQAFHQNEAIFWCVVSAIAKIREIHIAR